MNELAERWLSFAEEDLQVAQLSLNEEIYNQACFHAQQCVEKLLKALIADVDEVPPKTHKLTDLLEIIPENVLPEYRKDMRHLDRFYIPTRYPDALPGSLPEGLPNKDDAEAAVETAIQLVSTVKNILKSSS